MMREERLLILEMLAEGKISVEEADRLLAALEAEEADAEADEEDEEDGPTHGFHFEWTFDEPFGAAMGAAFGSVDAMADAWATFGDQQKEKFVRIF
jgi:hypothetical protein